MCTLHIFTNIDTQMWVHVLLVSTKIFQNRIRGRSTRSGTQKIGEKSHIRAQRGPEPAGVDNKCLGASKITVKC